MAAVSSVGAVISGFVYVSDEDPGPMIGASTGMRVANTSLAPPWIVVDHSLDRVLVAKWPGRLFRVASVPPRSDAERDALVRAAEGVLPSAGYTRVLAVDVLEELTPAILFGPHGDAVVRIIDVGRRLTENLARQLAPKRHPEATEAYRRAWARWLAGQPDGLSFQDHDLSHTLAVHGAGHSGSPIGHGFLVVSTSVRGSAQQRGGITVDVDGEEVLVKPWAGAAATLLDAVMAFGAPDLVSPEDHAMLTAAWRSVIEDDPPADA
jgi:hypothetical protein